MTVLLAIAEEALVLQTSTSDAKGSDKLVKTTAAPEENNENEEDWEKIEYAETEEGKAPSHVAWGHMHLKIGPKSRRRTLFSVDWSKLTYDD